MLDTDTDADRRRGTSLWLSVAAMVLLQALLVYPSTSCLLDSLQDEGAIAGAASRVLSGQAPFRDFVSRMMPGSYYTVGIWMAIFGQTIAALRGYFLLEACLLAGLVQLLSCRILPPRWSELPALLFMATGVQFFPLASFHWDASIASLAAILVLWGQPGAASAQITARRDVMAGILCGASVLFLQTKGLATCLGCGLSLLLARRPALPALGRLVAGAAIPGLPFVAYLLGSGSWGPFWAQTLGITKGNYALYQKVSFSTDVVWSQLGGMVEGTRTLPFPPSGAQLWWLARGWSFALVDLVKYAGYYPVLLLVLAYLARRWWTERENLSSAERHLLALSLVLGTASLFDLVRANRYRLVLQTPLWSVLLAFLLCLLYRRWRRPGLTLAISIAAVFAVHGLDNALGWTGYRYPVRTPRGVLFASHPAIAARAQATMDVVQQATRPGDPLVGFPDVPLFVWLTGHPNPTHLDELFPVLTPRPDLEEAVRAVAATRPPLLLFFPLDPNLGGDYPALPATLMAQEQEWLRSSLTKGYASHQGPGFLFYLAAPDGGDGMGAGQPNR